ncbi:SWIM zinc finger family protein [Aquisphaera insulae]|uniref:SWIM zinc finger family protein n=1 Tax=Aquisphaera insulae TaxID=2712864 RepID=UPI0013EB6211|nr:SWIM zinc finger family protein [Aquisphaera insulae]
MDGADPLVATFRLALAAFDDEALAALANRGLVRRARKDLESVTPRLLGPGEKPDRLRVEVGDGVAELALPPVQSRCSCPASGICRHILTALIFVKESEAGTEATPAPESMTVSASAEVLALDDDALIKWAGRPLFNKVRKLLAQGLPVELEPGDVLTARLPTRNVSCRWMTAGGLDGMICSCHAAGACEHRVAAVLAFQIERGSRPAEVHAELALAASTDAPRSREEVLASVGDALAQMIVTGLSRLSRGTAERLRTLAISAQGVDLPRLQRLLQALSSEVELYLNRDAQADAARVLGQAARVEVLRLGLVKKPSPRLVGVHRTTYEPVGDLDLIGLGARVWQTRSGFEGLTVYFWDRSARGWATWSDSRPIGTPGFDPSGRFRAEGPWYGLASPAEASRRVIRLTGAYRNRQGRLSGRPSTQAMALGPSIPDEVPAWIARWSELPDRAATLFGGGLADRSEQDSIVLIAPAAWEPASFDDLRQQMVRNVLDAEGRRLPLVVRHEAGAGQAATMLEAHDPSGTTSILGLLILEADRLCVLPVTLHTARGPVHLTLDSARKVSPARRPAVAVSAGPEQIETDPDPEDDPEVEESATSLGRFLEQVSGDLLAIAEGGPAAFGKVGEVRRASRQLEAVGLGVLAIVMEKVADGLEAQRRGELSNSSPLAHDLLACYHVARLCQSQESVQQAADSLGIHP